MLFVFLKHHMNSHNHLLINNIEILKFSLDRTFMTLCVEINLIRFTKR